MSIDPGVPLPFITADLPPLGGRIKAQPEDFEVEEIPAYLPSGAGPFLYLWIEKRDLGAEFFQRQVARRLGISAGEIGTAGLKDRRAVTRQWVSVPAKVEDRLARLDGEGIRLLNVQRHGNKLKAGHLRGNRFRIRIRDAGAVSPPLQEAYTRRLTERGVPNFYGWQRFGRAGETLELGRAMLRGQRRPPRNRFLRKLALSAVQSQLFNRYLAQRVHDGLTFEVLDGDVMAKLPVGGLFVARDLPTEQARFDRHETVHTGPMFGRKMFQAEGRAAERENQTLHDAKLALAAFHGHGKLLQGTRRHNLFYPQALTLVGEGADVWLECELPAGSYATILLRELLKREEWEELETTADTDGAD